MICAHVLEHAAIHHRFSAQITLVSRKTSVKSASFLSVQIVTNHVRVTYEKD
jgi:hypothetical protein